MPSRRNGLRTTAHTTLHGLRRAFPSSGRISGRTNTSRTTSAWTCSGGVDFKKGCYIGQEVVSRMERRGTARRRPVIVSGIDAAGAADRGRARGGYYRAVVGGRAVGVVRLDRFEGGPVTVGGKPVMMTLPDWAPTRSGNWRRLTRLRGHRGRSCRNPPPGPGNGC